MPAYRIVEMPDPLPGGLGDRPLQFSPSPPLERACMVEFTMDASWLRSLEDRNLADRPLQEVWACAMEHHRAVDWYSGEVRALAMHRLAQRVAEPRDDWGYLETRAWHWLVEPRERARYRGVALESASGAYDRLWLVRIFCPACPDIVRPHTRPPTTGAAPTTTLRRRLVFRGNHTD